MQIRSIRPGALTTYMIWSLKSNLLVVLLSEACAFWTLICIFAVAIYIGGSYQPECLRFPDHKNFEESGSYFIDAWTVSWTTFSTVVRLKFVVALIKLKPVRQKRQFVDH